MSSSLSPRNFFALFRWATFSLAATSAFLLLTLPGASSFGQSIELVDPAMTIESGKTITVTAKYDLPAKGIVQVQLMRSDWKKVGEQWKEMAAGASEVEMKIKVPADETSEKFIWQAILYDASWKKLKDQTVTDVVAGTATTEDTEELMPETESETEADSKSETDSKPKTAADKTPPSTTPLPSGTAASDDDTWVPAGSWKLDWSDEFNGKGKPEKWYPMLGYNPDEMKKREEKGLRWSGPTDDTAWMYSTKEGNHWMDGEGNLVLRIVAKKKESNKNGPKVEAAYLLSGYPDKWDSSENNNVKWAGKFVSPKDGPLYICARIKTGQVKGHSTWFAFWLFSQTRAYNGNPADGSEVDIMEVAKGAPKYMNSSFQCC